MYSKLTVPKDSAWGKKTWRYYAPNWFKNFTDGVHNLWRWKKVMWNDRNWDHNYIYDVLLHKLLLQREYLVKHNRFEGIEQVNRDITICLNLIERLKSDYYVMEYMDYDDHWGTVGTLDEYFNMHRSTVKRCLKKDRNLMNDKRLLAMRVARANQDKAQALLFRILNEKINTFWD